MKKPTGYPTIPEAKLSDPFMGIAGVASDSQQSDLGKCGDLEKVFLYLHSQLYKPKTCWQMSQKAYIGCDGNKRLPQ